VLDQRRGRAAVGYRLSTQHPLESGALHRGLLSLYGTDEPKPAAVNRLDESGMAGVVAKGLPKLADRLSQSVLGHRDIGPDRVEQLLVRH